MGKNVLLCAFVALAALASCSPRPTDKGEEVHSQVLELMQTVPSDALAVICRDECEDALSLIDSNNVLHKLDLGELSDSPAVISFSYEGSLRANMAIDAGRKATDSTLAVSSLMLQARQLRLPSRFIPADEDGRPLLIIASSESQMNAIIRHISEGRSIMEADRFPDALKASEGAKDVVLLRNSGATRLAPREAFSGIFSRRDACRFLAAYSEWTVMLPQRDGSFRVKNVQDESFRHFANMLESLPGEKLQIESMAPDSCDFVLSLAVPEEFREAYEMYMDASVRLNSYRKRIQDLKAASGKDPLKWEKELDIKEVSLVHWQGEELLFVRTDGKAKESRTGANAYRHFAGALYGSAFDIKDDSFFANSEDWYIFGGETAVGAFVEYNSSRETRPNLKRAEGHFLIKYGELDLLWDKKDFTLWNSNL